LLRAVYPEDGGKPWDAWVGVRALGVASVRCTYAGLNVRSA